MGSAYRTLSYWVKSGICQTGHKDALKLIGSDVPQELREKITSEPLGTYRPANEDEMEMLSKDFELTLDELNPWRDDRISL